MGSELIRRGVNLPNHVWSADSNITNSQLVYEIHKDYVEAGCNYITTNTFRTTPRSYKKLGLSNSDSKSIAYKSLKKAVKLAHEASNNKCKILGSIAPLEDCYKPELFPGKENASIEFYEIGKWLVDEGVDTFILETMNSLKETLICIESISSFKIPIWVSFVMKNQVELLSGDRLVDCLNELKKYNIKFVLLNCNPLDRTIQSMKILADNWSQGWGIYPNLGIGEPSPDGKIDQTYSNDEFIDVIQKSIDIGVNIIGGCCGSNVNHIKLLYNYINLK